jgi:ribonuclease P protein component
MALPQRHRLKGKRVFDRLYQKGRRLQGQALLLRCLECCHQLLPPDQRAHPPTSWRCGVVVSAKVHRRAVRRNRLRRILQSHLLRVLPVGAAAGQWLLISLKPGSAEWAEEALLGECDQLLHQAGLTP